MIEKNLVTKLKKNYQDSESARRQIGASANGLLFAAKKIIFAIQRHDLGLAEKKLSELEAAFKQAAKEFGLARLRQEGGYRAATEEYLEARALFDVIKSGRVKAAQRVSLTHEDYLGGVCDLIGELVRYATNQAASGKFAEAIEIKEIAAGIMSQLSDFDMTGYLRTKYDQARGHLRKLEQIAYEISIRSLR